MIGLKRLFAAAILVVVAPLSIPCQTTIAADKLALLVGCSDYPANGDWALVGAKNDVFAFEKLLGTRFGFKRIETLVGWPEDQSSRPTAENISKAFDRLIAEAKPNSQVFILMSGHGKQVSLPEWQSDWLDERNPEPDGKDEVFLAADFDGHDNLIRDNQIGGWLDILVKEKQAHVWIVFDSCFSGTMSRGADEIEFPRTIKDSSNDATRPKPVQKLQVANIPKFSPLLEKTLSTHDSNTGSLVAFYAAQEFETAAELIRPQGADQSDPANRHGLLSYHIERVLSEQQNRLSYADLCRAVISRYRAEGRKRPTPMYEGDIDREVFGVAKNWPKPQPLMLSKVGDTWQLNAGQFAGVSVGAVMAAYESDEAKEILATFRVISVSPTSAELEFDTRNKDDERKPENNFPESCFCRIVSQDIGSQRLRLKVLVKQPDSKTKLDALASELSQLAELPSSVFTLVDDKENSDWILTIDSLKPLSGVPKAIVYFRQTSDVLLEKDVRIEETVHAEYAVEENTSKLAGKISEDLRKIYAWQNLWKLSGMYSEPSPFVGSQEIRLDVMIENQGTNAVSRTNHISAGDALNVRLLNDGPRDYWYAVFLLNGRYGINELKFGAIPRRNTNESQSSVREIARHRVGNDSVGNNGLIVIAIDQREHPFQPDYRFLCQPNIGIPGTRASVDSSTLTSPFDRIVLETNQYRTSYRGSSSSDEPQIAAWSWVTANNP